MAAARVKTVRPRYTPGGVRLPNFTSPSLRSRLMPTPLPARLTLKFTVGGSVRLLFKEGDLVRQDQPLTEVQDLNHAPTFTPAAGTVSALHIAGDVATVTVVPSREERVHDHEALVDYQSLAPLELITRVAAAGIVGLGGSGAATAARLKAGLDRGVDTLIVNAVESDPYTSADEALVREHAAAVATGADILRLACDASRCLVAISAEKKAAITALRRALAGTELALMVMPDRYPAGDAHQLVLAAGGRELASSQTTLDAGCLVFNAGTAHAVQRAICHGHPLTGRVVTVTGGAVATPKNLAVPFGTPVRHLLALCGADTTAQSAILLGGIMRGTRLDDPGRGIDAATNCIIALGPDELPPARPESACIQCGRCADVCPVRLQPQRLYDFARARRQQALRDWRLSDCTACGACTYICPSGIPLGDYFKAAVTELKQQDRNREQGAYWQRRFQFHQARLRREQDQANSPQPPAGTDEATANTALTREQAQREIAAAVARVKARRAGTAGTKPDSDDAS